MIDVNGRSQKTIEEAASELHVHPKTLRSYIAKRIVSEPPVVAVGLVDRRYFPPELLKQYKSQIASHREARRQRK